MFKHENLCLNMVFVQTYTFMFKHRALMFKHEFFMFKHNFSQDEGAVDEIFSCLNMNQKVKKWKYLNLDVIFSQNTSFLPAKKISYFLCLYQG